MTIISSKFCDLPLHLVNEILSFNNYIDELERLFVEHSNHYGYYAPIDEKIETILKVIVYYPVLLQSAKDNIKYFTNVLNLHSPVPKIHMDSSNKYFSGINYWKSFSMDLSWERYHQNYFICNYKWTITTIYKYRT
jgi:hypothetical protein